MPNVFWAAFGGGAAAGIFTLFALTFTEWLKRYLDRPLVRVSVLWVYQIGGLSNSPVRKISIEAVNPHSHSVTLSSYGFSLKGKDKYSLAITEPEPYRLPQELGCGKSISEHLIVDELFYGLRRANRKPNDLSYAWFKTQSGKTYRRKLVKVFIQTLQKEFENWTPTS